MRGFPLAGTKEVENVFLTHGWEYGFECAEDLQVTWYFRVQLFVAFCHCLTLFSLSIFKIPLFWFWPFFVILFDGEGEFTHKMYSSFTYMKQRA